MYLKCLVCPPLTDTVVLVYTASFHSTSLKIVSSWLTSAADHCDRLMSWRVPQWEHERVSETGVFPSLDRVSGTLCRSHYVTEISHLYSLRDFWRHFGLCIGLRRIVTVAFLCHVQIFLLTYLLKYHTCCYEAVYLHQQSQWVDHEDVMILC